MKPENSFVAFIREQLAALPDVTFRPMFGGHGLYLESVFSGLLDEGRLYLRVDDTTRPRFAALGMGPFRPTADQCMNNYFEVPPAIVEDRAALCAWLTEAASVARHAQLRRLPRTKKAAARRPPRD